MAGRPWQILSWHLLPPPPPPNHGFTVPLVDSAVRWEMLLGWFSQSCCCSGEKHLTCSVPPPCPGSGSCFQSQTDSFRVHRVQVSGILANAPVEAESASPRKRGLIFGAAFARSTFPPMLSWKTVQTSLATGRIRPLCVCSHFLFRPELCCYAVDAK